MDKRESMWDLYLKKGMSRRTFVKSCVALTSLMGLSTDQVSKVVEAAEKKPLPGLAAVCRLSSMSLRSLVVKAFQNGMNCSGVIWVVSFQLVNKS